MRLLAIDNSTKEVIRKVKEHAEKNIFSFDDLLDIKNGQAPPPGDREGFMCVIPMGFTVVYSLEKNQVKGRGECLLRHISISVDKPGQLPNPYACEMIIKEFGFINEMENCVLDYQPGLDVIGILEIIE